jgi:outer membrane protein insertion porin family
MQKKIISLLLSFLFFSLVYAQQELPVINYSTNPPEYEIANISVKGAINYEDFVLIGFSGLSVGQVIKVPGDEITNAVKRFWKQGLFSNVKIKAEKIEEGKVWLLIELEQYPRISQINYTGLKKTDIEEIESTIELKKGTQITANRIDQTKKSIKKYLHEKGYYEASVDISQKDDYTIKGGVIVDINVDKKGKIKVNKITIEGNNNLAFKKINRVMKKTNEKGKLENLFSPKNFVETLYQEDKIALINKYNELGYRDAHIVVDSVTKFDDKSVNIYIKIDEGKKYFIRDVKWVGNTVYPVEFLNQVLRIKKGDIYNVKLLNERLLMDDDAVANLYQDRGYLFFNIDPVEVRIENDSIDFEMRLYEGKQATINSVGITGNSRVYEHVVRRELRTKPGDLYNKSDIIRTLRELAQMGHFDPEKITPDIKPNVEDGTVDINYQLETKASDQIEFSAGYGQTGIIGTLSLKFSNFAIQNIFKPETYKIVPQGEGQTFSIRGQTNGSYYSSFSFSFLEPWLGGKRPNSLSVSAYYSMQTGVSSRYSSNYYDYYSSLSGSGLNSGYYYDADPDQYINTIGASVGFGKRLNWPDDYFTFYGELSYQNYNLKNWRYFIMTDGVSNNLKLGLTVSRNSIDNPIYTRKGSSFTLSVEATPPYSAFTGTDYSTAPEAVKYSWLEYHKWKLKAKIFTPLSTDQKLVLMARAEYGFLGYYNKYRRSPFETFYMGGDGMTGSYTSYASETIGLRGYTNGSLTPYSSNGGQNGNLYTRLTLELRYPLVLEASTTIYALAFLEGGNCWAEFSDFNPFNLKRSVGVGLRLYLPMFGMMGIDWGYGFDKISGSAKYEPSQFHFIIGQEF